MPQPFGRPQNSVTSQVFYPQSETMASEAPMKSESNLAEKIKSSLIFDRINTGSMSKLSSEQSANQ